MKNRTQVHGHRGCAGLFPPNTVRAFVEAARTGCHYLEMDVVSSSDGHLLVSHEPWMDHESCLDPDGQALTVEQGRSANIFRMLLADVQRYGLLGGEEPHCKPTLAEVNAAVVKDCQARGAAQPGFNIELKSDPVWYGIYQPFPEAFARAVIDEVHRLDLGKQCLMQSFDPAVLRALHRLQPTIPLTLLVEQQRGVQESLAQLDFTPRYYGPQYQQIDEALVAELRVRGIGLMAWTVNREYEMRRMIALGVDGLITDEPAKALALLAADH
jgi:glycerophosphoryl diester phosphodiesterase